jgi:hypothetical protein
MYKVRVDCVWDIQAKRIIKKISTPFSARQWIASVYDEHSESIFLISHSTMMTKMLIRWLP